ncbi:geranylgeranylglycerol-phosphate geranylgeranyltransferase [Methanoregula sp.]|uniref:geranylgeranylglycerol-phosphate geranylgeranyltransferase n=1 Tax=Methanoregula sp. TaxID=2052170 RepID=UPI003565C60D
MSLHGYFSITRPVNAFVAGIAAVIAYLIATGTVTPSSLLLLIVVALITAAGNTINDYFDAEIDAVNRSDRPIPSGQVPRSAALWYSLILFLVGIGVCTLTNPLCMGIAIINSLLLIAYAARLKTTPLFGNVAVAYLAGSMFLFGGALNGAAGLFHMIPIALMTFLAMMVRELLKDAEDVDGDAACGASTLPIRIGVKKTARIAFGFMVLAAITSLLPSAWWGGWYIAGILIVDALLLGAAALALRCETPACVRASKAATFLKYGMFASLVVFTLSAVLLG